MPTDRELGWQAFQEKNVTLAASLLEAACEQNPSDFQAHLYVTAVYGELGRHQEAINHAAHAVRLQPASVQARYNFGVALERADQFASALDAYRQALLLDPNYARAQEAAARLQTEHGAAHDGAEHSLVFDLAPSPANRDTVPSPLPAADQRARANGEPIWQAGSPFAPPQPAETSGAGALPPHGLLSDYSPSPHAGAQPLPPSAPYAATAPAPNYNDEMDIGKTFRHFGQLIVSPVTFFREQQGSRGFMAPILMIGLYALFTAIVSVFYNLRQGPLAVGISVVMVPLSVGMSIVGSLLSYLVYAVLVHLLGAIFGNREDFSGSFRACVYSDAPKMVMTWVTILFVSLVMLTWPGGQLPISSTEVEEALNLPAGSVHLEQNSVYSQTQPYAASRAAKKRRQAATVGAPPDMGKIWKLIGVVVDRVKPIIIGSVVLTAIAAIWSSVLLGIAVHYYHKISKTAAALVVSALWLMNLVLVAISLYIGYRLILFFLDLFMRTATGAAGGPKL